MPFSHGECSFRRGVSVPRIFTACFPLLNSFLNLSNKNRMNSCASCCSFPANDGTSLHTLRNKSCGGNASYSPSISVRITDRISAPTSSVSALAISARLSRVIAGGRIANLLFAPPRSLALVVPASSRPASPSLAVDSLVPRPDRPSVRRFRFSDASNVSTSSPASNDRARARPRVARADKNAAASSPSRYSRNARTCRSACARVVVVSRRSRRASSSSSSPSSPSGRASAIARRAIARADAPGGWRSGNTCSTRCTGPREGARATRGRRRQRARRRARARATSRDGAVCGGREREKSGGRAPGIRNRERGARRVRARRGEGEGRARRRRTAGE